jgi:hypothetical protein
VFLLVIAAALAGPSEAAEIYRRATVFEDRIGKTYLRSAYGVRLTVLTDCESNPDGCLEEQVYDEVVRLDFASEHRELAGDEVIRTEEPAGSILMALAFSQDDLETFRTELQDRLRRLSAQAFVQAFAGWRPMAPPFDRKLGALSERPTWVCFESDEWARVVRFHRKIDRYPDGGESLATGSETYETAPTPICSEMAEATEGTYPEVIDTLAVPGKLLEVAVFHEDAVNLDTESPDALAPRPDDVLFVRRKVPENWKGKASGGDETRSVASHVSGGWRFDAQAVPATISSGAVDRNAWLHRWTIETIERQLGPEPIDRVVGKTVLQVAYLATVPAAIADPDEEVGLHTPIVMPSAHEVPPSSPAHIDRAAFLDKLVGRLDRHHGPPSELLEELVTRPEAGLESDAWISVLCREDGSATYYLPPTQAHHRVLNPDLFCAAVESELQRSR